MDRVLSFGRGAGGTGISRKNWNEIWLFCLIAFGLSWLYWIPFMARGMEGLRAFPGPYGFANGMFGPLLAALFMRLFISREGLRGSLGVVRHWKYYLVALLSPALYAGLLVLVITAVGASTFSRPGDSPFLPAMGLLILKSLGELPLGLGEEYGWRGYMLPRLLHLGEARATLVLGVVWGLWHLPMMVLGLNYPGQNPFLASLVFMLFVVLMSFPFTWLFLWSRGSVLVVSLLHIALDVFTDTFCSPRCLPEGNQLLVSSAGLISCALLVIIVAARYSLLKGIRLDAQPWQRGGSSGRV